MRVTNSVLHLYVCEIAKLSHFSTGVHLIHPYCRATIVFRTTGFWSLSIVRYFKKQKNTTFRKIATITVIEASSF
jgi:hypothetical protein